MPTASQTAVQHAAGPGSTSFHGPKLKFDSVFPVARDVDFEIAASC
jgi:hypothetical protein